jgi:hypothetical protein
MPTTNNNRKILDLKRWEFCTPAPVVTAAGVCVGSSRHYRQQQLFLASNTVAYLYNPSEDGYVQLPSPALAGTFGAGAAITSGSFSIGTTTGATTLTATAGGASTLTTNQTIARNLKGYSIQIVGGPGAGDTREIASNTIGASSIITVTAPFSATPTTSTTYRLITPVWYAVGAGTTAAGSFRKYCFATNTWTSLANTGLPATIATDGRLIATPSWIDNDYNNFATGTATAGAASTITNSAKTWTANQWANYQIRITAGTGIGQIRTIASNTGTVITVAAAWATTPDATSVYAIQGNDDFIYYMGNGAVTLYRYTISTNTWATLAPTAARAGAAGLAASASWVWGVTESSWSDENAIINGRRIYSFRGGASAILDYYDIAINTWVSGVVYAPLVETFTTGSKYVYKGDFLYIQKEATGRWFRYSFPHNEMDGWNTMTFTQGSAVVGDTAWDITYVDGATEITYVYMLLNTSAVLLRQMVV